MNLALSGPRLRLRPLQASDLDHCIELFTDERVTKYVSEPQSEAHVVAEMPLALRRGAGGCLGVWCVLSHETGEKLGTAMLLPLPTDKEDTDWDLLGGTALPAAEIEVGYHFKPGAWGHGYATEAAGLLLQFAFQETALQEVVAVIDPENASSRKVLLKAGLAETGPRLAYAMELPGFRITRDAWCEQRRNVEGD